MTKAQREQLVDILREVVMGGETDKAAAEIAEVLELDLSRRELRHLETRIASLIPWVKSTRGNAMEAMVEEVLRAVPVPVAA